MAPTTADDTDREDDAHSQSPLLPTNSTTSASSPSHQPKQPTSKRAFLAAVFLLVFGLGVLYLAFGASYQDRKEGADEDEKWPVGTKVGFGGPTPTGVEAFAAATSYPSNNDFFPLNPPKATEDFNILHYLGNLSPWRTVNHGLNSTAQVPEGCEVEQVQLLHRHGARYPTTGSGTATFATDVVGAPGFKASGELSWLNGWKYKLGAEVLTPFGREQLFNLGTSFRVKYGHLLQKGKKPVFRTESQDRMLYSALNFAAGFFGIPYEEQYHQLIMIEAPGYNATGAPYMTCKNANRYDLTKGPQKMAKWMSIYLVDALERLAPLVEGVELTVKDLFNMQLMCAYELVALGGSAFCPLFTEDEWKGFEYGHDLLFWDVYSYGQPSSAASGKGWVQEWVARTLKQPLSEFNSTTNATWHTPEYFPLDQLLHVDATHDTIISAVLTTLNFTSFSRSGTLPDDHIPANLSFIASSISPFAANLHSQVLSCPSSPLVTADKHRFVRWILNDGVVPLANLPGCVENDEGMCELGAFVAATQENLESIDWAYDCLEPYDYPADPPINGRPPPRGR